jgi:transcriptional regulator with XRE-family HTH domain
MTEGRAALIASGATLATIAARAHVGRIVAQRWRHGLDRPDAAARARLSVAPFGIDPDAWDALAAQRARPALPPIAPSVERVLVDVLQRASGAGEWPAVVALAEVLKARAETACSS